VVTAKPQAVSFPDGTVGRRYDFVFVPADLTTPDKISLVAGGLPTGLTVNQMTGGIEGEAKQAGEWKLTLQVVDARGQQRLFTGTVRIWRVLTVGEHGQFQGAEGLQMALNIAQDMDEIRIERGTIRGSGLSIPQNKVWERGMKISGGWNETFDRQSNNPEDMTLDSAGQKVAS
jgi:hypothetical protein